MRKEDLIQDLSIFGVRYAKLLTSRISLDELAKLKKKYRYLYICSFADPGDRELACTTQKTLILDLTLDPEKLFSGFNDTCKKHIRRAQKNSLLEVRALDNDFEGSYALYKNIKSMEGVKPDIRREFKNCIFFNAYYKGNMIVTASFDDNGEIIRAKHIASTRKLIGEESKIVAHANRLINWEVCEWGHANGRKVFDLAGITDDPAKAGIRTFKESFGGMPSEIYRLRYETPIFTIIKKTVNFMGYNIL